MDEDELGPQDADTFEEADEFDEVLPDDLDEGGQQDDQALDLDEAPPEQEEQPRRQSRATARVQAALAENKRLQRELAEERANKQRQEQQSASERERAYLDSLDPFERIEYRQQQQDARFAQLERNAADAADKAAFAAKCAANSRLARVAAEVEETLAASRANGVTVPRDTVAAYILGQKVLNGAPAARAKQAKAAAANMDRQRAKPVSGGSDVSAASAKSEREARMERLRNTTL